MHEPVSFERSAIRLSLNSVYRHFELWSRSIENFSYMNRISFRSIFPAVGIFEALQVVDE
jgi:hypothetical protein